MTKVISSIQLLVFSISALPNAIFASSLPQLWTDAVSRGDMIVAYPDEDNDFDIGLMPSIANGFVGATIGIDALYMAGVYVNEVEWVEAGCLQVPCLGNNESKIDFDRLGKLLNPQGRYELSGLCERFDELIKANNSRLDIVEHGFGSRRARLPYPHAVSMTLSPKTLNKQTESNQSSAVALDMANAMVYRRAQLNDAIAHQTWFTHRHNRSLLAMEVSLNNSASSTPAELVLIYDEIRGLPEDIVFQDEVDGATYGISNMSTCKQGYLSRPESAEAVNVLVATCAHTIPKTLDADPFGVTTITYLVSVHSSLECNDTSTVSNEGKKLSSTSSCDPMMAAAADLIHGEAQVLNLQQSHISAWNAVRQAGWVEISAPTNNNNDDNGSGNSLPDMAVRVNASMYDLLSTLRADWHWPSSPGSLATPGYWGQVCWDAETFIAPALQPFHPDIIAAGLQYRVDRMSPAQDYAIENGYEGCMIPWQSGSSGHEVDLAPFANTPEQHIGGDLILLMQKHFYQTNDTNWLAEKGGEELASCIAQFYASRVVSVDGEDNTTTYSIEGVIGPDEFAIGSPPYSGNTDNPWTNYVASRSLEFGAMAQQVLGKNPPENWADIASNLPIIYDDATGVHPEYVGFNTAQCYDYNVKQADVTLLTYPGDMINQSTESILADLTCYEQAYDEDGPAMTYAISTIDYLEANQLESASQWLDTTVRNQQQPYRVWTETVDPKYHPSDMGCYHFLTGAGGFMQAIIHGYGGLRIRQEGIRVRPQLLPSTNKLSLHGIYYLNQRIDATREGNTVSFSLQQGDDATGGDSVLKVRDDVSQEMFDMPCSFVIDSSQVLGSWTIMPTTSS